MAGPEVVGAAATGPAAVEAGRRLRPDVVLMDIEMPGGGRLTRSRQILADWAESRVLTLTTFHLDDYVFQALRVAASGFLLKTTPPAKLVEAVQACAAGETPLARVARTATACSPARRRRAL